MKNKKNKIVFIGVTSLIIAFVIIITQSIFSNFLGENLLPLLIAVVLVIVSMVCGMIYMDEGHADSANVSRKFIPVEFEQLYERLHYENIETLKKLKRGLPLQTILLYMSFIFIMLLIYILINCRGKEFLMMAAFCAGVVIIDLIIFNRFFEREQIYKEYFKENIVKEIMKSKFPGLVYQYEISTEEKENIKNFYAKSSNSKRFEMMVNDYAFMPINRETTLNIAKIATFLYKRVGPHYGLERTHDKYPIFLDFDGLFAYANFNSFVDCEINIKTLGNNINGRFEDYFKIISNNEHTTRLVVTNEMKKMLLEIYQKYKLKFEINISNNVVSFKFFTKAMFEPDIFGDPLDKKYLLDFYDTLDCIYILTTNMIRNLK